MYLVEEYVAYAYDLVRKGIFSNKRNYTAIFAALKNNLCYVERRNLLNFLFVFFSPWQF